MRVSNVFPVVVVAVSVLAFAGCGGGAAKPPATPQCVLASDCKNASLQCAQGYCVNVCNTSVDCPSGQRCIATEGGTTCQPPEKKTCGLNSDCSPLFCALDLVCRNECSTDVDCPGGGLANGQKCTESKRCVDPVLDKNYDPATNELRPPGSAGTGGGSGTGGGAGAAGGAAAGGGNGQIRDGIEGEMAGDLFGTAVALSANGTRVVIGGPGNDGTAANAGHARVFERSGNTWIQLGADLDGEAAEDQFGGSVAINDAGTRVAVGSYLNDGGGTSSGHVRVFDYAGGAWTQVGADIDGTSSDGAGWAVAMSATGHRVIIGAPEAGGTPGHARIYEHTTGVWTQVGVDFPTGPELGHAVAMSDDGNRIAFSYPSASGLTQPGFTQIHDWNGTVWTQVGATIAGEAINDQSGVSLSLSADGSMIAIGADQNVGGGAGGGHVRVFRLTAGTWTQVGVDIDGPMALPSGGGFGQSVSLSADGTRLISAGNGGGKASIGIYTLSGDTWTKSTALDFGTGGRLGAVSISADGSTVAIGEVYFAGMAGNASGIVRLYALP